MSYEERKKRVIGKIRSLFHPDDVFWNNEIKANIFTACALVLLTSVLLLSALLAKVGVFDIPDGQMKWALITNVPLTVIVVAIAQYFKGQRPWIKYMLCVTCLFVAMAMCSTLNIFVSLVIAIPVVVSVRYYSRRFTVTIALLSVIGMAVSEQIFGNNGMLNLNLYPSVGVGVIDLTAMDLRTALTGLSYDKTQYLSNLFRGSFMPRLLLFFIIALACAEMAHRAHDLVLEQEAVARRNESIRTELNMAAEIQNAVMPKIFPPFPDRPEIDIFAATKPAKTVGGDFYDFYMLDDDHLAIVMADVAGKGVPAALFMMIGEALIKTHAYTTGIVHEIAEHTNDALCTDNTMDMFITAWIGVLQLSTGSLTFADCGHEYPALRRAGGQFELLKGKKSLVLGAMSGVKYKENTLQLNEGDTLFLYTDGVPEATDASETLYGVNRMLETLNSEQEAGPQRLLELIQDGVDAFVGDAPQFDDLTMLAIRMKR